MSKKHGHGKQKNGGLISINTKKTDDNAPPSSVAVEDPRSIYISAPRLRKFASAQKSDTDSKLLTSRRGAEEDEDGFAAVYGSSAGSLLVQPVFPFEWCWKQYRECDTLNLCVEAEVDNCVNVADVSWEGEKGKENEDGAPERKRTLSDLFKRVNEKDSLFDLQEKVQRDRSVTRQGFIQVIRDSNLELVPETGRYRVAGKPDRFYYMPSTHIRTTYLQAEEVPIDILLPRNGKLVPVTIKKKFRKFAQRDPRTNDLTWFKEFGDPRVMDARTGEYGPTDNEATEIWWFRDTCAGEVYGVPRWTSVAWDIAGRNCAKWINFDHLDQGAIPPGFFTVTGGKMTEKSKKMLDTVLTELRDPKFFNRFFFLEVNPDINLDLNGGQSKLPQINYHKLRDPQHEDFMNEKFLGSTKDDIRQLFRMPPVLTGVAGSDTFASAYVSLEVAESQVFQPTKNRTDSQWTTELIQNEFGIYDWKLKTRQGKIGDKETFYKAVGALSRAGALTINDVRELSNQLLGTSFAPFQGEVYNEPKTLVDALAGLGMVKFDEASKALIFTEPVSVDMFDAVEPSGNSGKSDTGQTEMEALSQRLVDVLEEIEKLQTTYAPPEIDEQDVVL